MGQFECFTNNKGLFIGVDFGSGDDFGVETQIQKLPNGDLKILSSNIIGRVREMINEKRQIIYNHYKDICNQE